MSDKLQEITEKLYHDGVEKALRESETIIAEARQKSLEIKRLAEEEAAAIEERAQKNADSLLARARGELKLAARQAEEVLKQRLVNLISGKLLGKGVGNALADGSFLKHLILLSMKNWSDSGATPDVRLVLGKGEQDAFVESLKGELASQLRDGVTVEFSDRIKGGFRIEARNGSYMLSFTDKDFEEYFRSFIKDQIRSVLFAEA